MSSNMLAHLYNILITTCAFNIQYATDDCKNMPYRGTVKDRFD